MQEQLQHSQNFIRNPETIKRLLRKSDIKKTDIALDLGAGDGLITKELAKVAKSVISIELDAERIANLRATLPLDSNIQILQQDFFQYELPAEPYKVFSNPPFNRISDIVRRFLDASNPPVLTYLFMQKEAAHRFIHHEDERNSQISLIYHPRFEIEIISRVDRTSFIPVPNIDIVFVEFKKRKKPLVSEEKLNMYNDFISYCFNQWQPTVLDSLKNVFTKEQIKRIDQQQKLKGLKPSELTFKEWMKLFESFLTYVNRDRQDLVKDSYIKLLASQESLEKRHKTI